MTRNSVNGMCIFGVNASLLAVNSIVGGTQMRLRGGQSLEAQFHRNQPWESAVSAVLAASDRTLPQNGEVFPQSDHGISSVWETGSLLQL